MSYELCKRITLNEKKNKITLTTASNNVYPKDYSTFTYCDSEQECYKNVSFEEKLISLMKNFLGRNIQISTINDNTIKFIHATMKMDEYIEENNLDDFDMYCNKDKYEKEYADLLQIFKNSIFDNDKKDYYLKIGNDLVTNKGRLHNGCIQGLRYGSYGGMKFKRQLAEIIQKQYRSYRLEIVPA